jgi:hypothetical protein
MREEPMLDNDDTWGNAATAIDRCESGEPA